MTDYLIVITMWSLLISMLALWQASKPTNKLEELYRQQRDLCNQAIRVVEELEASHDELAAKYNALREKLGDSLRVGRDLVDSVEMALNRADQLTKASSALIDTTTETMNTMREYSNRLTELSNKSVQLPRLSSQMFGDN